MFEPHFYESVILIGQQRALADFVDVIADKAQGVGELFASCVVLGIQGERLAMLTMMFRGGGRVEGLHKRRNHPLFG